MKDPAKNANAQHVALCKYQKVVGLYNTKWKSHSGEAVRIEMADDLRMALLNDAIGAVVESMPKGFEAISHGFLGC